jgi:hypothetical protein
MSTGIVKFKFKHQNVFDKIEFSGSEITVAELRIKIQEKLLLTDSGSNRNSTVLEITKLGTDELYEWDHELIPTHASVLVSRVPASKKTDKIVVEKSEFFAQDTSQAENYFALKPSIIQTELEALRRVPGVVVCNLCNWLMARVAGRHPVILTCCGSTVCFACANIGKPFCPMEKRELSKPLAFVTDKATERLVNVVSSHKQFFVFDSVKIPEDFLVEKQPELAEAEEIEVLDVDAFEPEVFDVDNPRPLTAKEIEVIERRERRKRKAIEILAKREGVVKGELTESDVNRLLKLELKTEIGGLENGTPEDEEMDDLAGRRPVVLEIPKLLTPEQFAAWQKQNARN